MTAVSPSTTQLAQDVALHILRVGQISDAHSNEDFEHINNLHGGDIRGISHYQEVKTVNGTVILTSKCSHGIEYTIEAKNRQVVDIIEDIFSVSYRGFLTVEHAAGPSAH